MSRVLSLCVIFTLVFTSSPLPFVLAAPPASIPQDFPAPAAGTTEIGGLIFRDFNANGVVDSQEPGFTNSLGSDDITVNAYDDTNAVISFATTNSDGTFLITGLTAGTDYRLEVTGLPSYLSAGAAHGNAAGTKSESLTTVATAGDNDILIGVNNPGDYCQSVDQVILGTTCFVDGDTNAAGSTTGSLDTFVAVPYDGSSKTGGPTAAETGSIWGVAYNSNLNVTYTAAALKRHTAVGPLGEGGIYQIDSAGTVTSGITIPGMTAIVRPDLPVDPIGPPFAPSYDPNAFAAVGTSSLGDIDFDEKTSTLYVMNLEDGQVEVINVNPTTGAMTMSTAISITDPGCTGGTARPFALTIHDDKLYAGVTCDASVSQDDADLDAYVMRLDGATWNTVPLQTAQNHIDLNYQKEPSFAVPGYPTLPTMVTFIPWKSTWADLVASAWPAGFVEIPGFEGKRFFYGDVNQPLLSDIQFDNDQSIIVTIMDRSGMQLGENNFSTIGGDTLVYELNTGGDILRSCYDYANDRYVLEGTGAECPQTDPVRTGEQFAEYYNGEIFLGTLSGFGNVSHPETVSGGAELIPGQDDLVISSMDPENFSSGGLIWLDNVSGERVNGIELYAGDASDGFSGKAVGIGDIEASCRPAPLEIGNYVWIDTDDDGVQDPSEAPLPGVTVELFDGASVIGTAVTDASGHYVFTGWDYDTTDAWESTTADPSSTDHDGIIPGGVLPNTAYTVRIDTTQAALTSYTRAKDNGTGSATNDNHDSDGVASGDYSQHTITTSAFAGGNDHRVDFGFVPLFDLALRKTLATGQAASIVQGANVVFEVEVFNQGNVDATAVDVTEYFPTGLTFTSSNASTVTQTENAAATTLTANGTGTTYTISSIPAGDSVVFEITTTSGAAFTGSPVNYAEISAATGGTDVDSTPDATNTNSDGEDPAADYINDEITEDGLGAAEDEDDHDGETVTVTATPIFDLALRKTLATGQAASIVQGANVVFEVEVFNQGNVDATAVDVTEYFPTGLTFTSSNASTVTQTENAAATTLTANGTGTTYTISSIPAGDSVVFEITTTSGAAFTGSPVNYAEISAATGGTDVDSTPDATNTNSDGEDPAADYINDEITEDGLGAAEDEDDHDGETVTVTATPIFDLALRKTLATGQAASIVQGANVVFEVEVFNQGNVDATAVDVTEYFPTGLTFTSSNASTVTQTENAAATTLTANGTGTTYTISSIPAGDSVVFEITTTSGAAFTGSPVNYAEISAATGGTDVDSTPDATNTNSDGEDPAADYINDEITEDGLGAAEDEDDHDGETVTVTATPIFDLALRKTLATGQAASIVQGANVVFEVEVFNQGNVDATAVDVTEYFPTGLTFTSSNASTVTQTENAAATTLTANGTGTTYTISSIPAGDSVVFEITTTSGAAFTGSPVNYAEISAATGGTDVDSTPDATNTNSDGEDPAADYINDEITEDGLGAAEDEDDHDGETVTVTATPIFDLALRKTLATGQAASIVQGANVVFEVEVFNQGNVDATAVDVTEYFPTGLTFTSSNASTVTQTENAAATTLTANGTGTTYTISSIPAGDSVVFEITTTSGAAFTGSPVNYAEISAATGGTDVDSTPDATNTNSDGEDPAADYINDEITEDGLGAAEDEDDHDGETVTVTATPIFDLALRKTLATGQAASIVQGANVVFEVEVFNQGNVDATAVDVTEYFPTGLTFTSSNASTVTQTENAAATTLTANGTGTTYTISSIPAGDSVVFEITTTSGAAFTGSPVNYAEISAATGGTDVDSTPDATNTNSDGEDPAADYINDEITEDGLGAAEDEDDHDGETVTVTATPIFDLALRKTLATGQAASIVQGANVVFEVEVFNQGNVDATAVDVTEYFPTGLTFTSSNASTVTQTENAAATTLTANGTGTTYTISSIPAGDSVVFEITTTSGAAFTGSPVNYAEISAATGGTDVDSTPDATNTNSDGEDPAADYINDEITEDGLGAAEDEDDHDGETVTVTATPIFDLALRKTLATGQAASIVQGANVVFEVEVFNQGNVDATAVDVTEYFPTGLTFTSSNASTVTQTENAAATTLTANGTGTTYTISSIPAGDSVVFEITTTSGAAFTGSPVNYAEISAATGGTDVDSTPDATNTNSDGEDPAADYINDEITEDGLGAAEDEDDHDGETVTVTATPIFDLALRKTLATGQAASIVQGANVVFEVEVFNQGNVDATAVDVTEYFPTGLTFTSSNASTVTQTENAAATTLTANGTGTTYTISSIPAGDSVVFEITTTSGAAFTGSPVNYAEISAATGGTDVDSTPDATNTNSDGEDPAADYINDEITEDGLGAAEDEDDHDGETVTVTATPIFDLALRKTLATGQAASIVQGANVVFEVEVFNQGNVDATAVDVTEYFPTGLTFTSSNASTVTQTENAAATTLTANGTGTTYTISSIPAGDSVVFEITTTSGAAFTGSPVNYAEISAATGGTDVDSTPDATNTNSDGEDPAADYINDEITEDGLGAAEDEDDHDGETVTVTATPIFDLALRKTLATGQAASIVQGANVVFEVEVFNQGNVDATAVDVTEYFPTGLTFTSSNASTVTQTENAAATTLTANGTGTTYTISSIPAGDSVVFEITTTSGAAFTGSPVNYAEISAATGGTDVDSTPDATNTNSDGEDPAADYINDEITEDGLGAAEDEDDHDGETVTVTATPIFDLALRKTLATGQAASIVQGANVVFEVEVFNQGNVDATAVDVTEYFPTGLTFTSSNASTVTQTENAAATTLTANGTGTTYTISSIPAGDSVVFEITTTSGAAFTGSPVNYAEISAATGGTDVDSTPDATNTNSDGEDPAADYINDEITEDGLGAAEDEDDHDGETVTVTATPIFDLALRKTLATGQAASIVQGANVVFEVEVFNQGNVDATAVDVTEYFPTGLTFTSSNASTVTQTENAAATTLTANGTGTTYTISSIPAGDSVVFEITTTSGAAFTGSPVNYAEISAATGGTDVDSTPDATNTNSDGEDPAADYINDEITEDGLGAAEDEDDHDGESVTVTATPVTPVTPIFDLALRLTGPASSVVSIGDNITFLVEIFNQGTIPADNISIAYFIPSGLTLNDGTWTPVGSDASRTISVASGEISTGGLLPGDSVTVPIVLQVSPSAVSGSLVNVAEISGATDQFGAAQVDIDSTPDAINGNDAGGVVDGSDDNRIDGNGSDDEDDSDPIQIYLDLSGSVSGTGSIGNYIWEDEDKDGKQDDDEDGIEDVTVVLRWAGPDNIFGTDDDQEWEDKTNSKGKYEFTDLPAGRYEIEVDEDDKDLDGFTLTSDPGDNNNYKDSIKLDAGEEYKKADFGFCDKDDEVLAKTGTNLLLYVLGGVLVLIVGTQLRGRLRRRK